MSQLGLHGLIVPERFGGAGLGVLDAAVTAEALGYAAAPVPFGGPTIMAPLAFMNCATEAQQDEYLPGVAAGEVRIAVGFASLAGQTGTSSATLDGTRLTGTVSGLMDAGAATHFLIFLRDGTAALVPANDSAVAVAQHRSLDRTRPLTDVSFNGASAKLLTAANDKLAAARRVLDAGRVVLAADSLGAAQTMLDRAVAFAKERVQFGRVIGSFQGVKYMLADCVTTSGAVPRHGVVRRACTGFPSGRGAPHRMPRQGARRRHRTRSRAHDHRDPRRHGVHRSFGPAFLV